MSAGHGCVPAQREVVGLVGLIAQVRPFDSAGAIAENSKTGSIFVLLVGMVISLA